MKTLIFFFIFCIQLSLNGYSQKNKNPYKIDNLRNKDTTLIKINLNEMMRKKKDLAAGPTTIPKTNITITPPSHFVYMEKMAGFIHPGSSSSIQVKEIKGTPYVIITKDLTSEYFNKQGLKLLKSEKVTLENNQPGMLFLAAFKIQGIDYERIMLFTGNYDKTVWISANYPTTVKFLLFQPLVNSLMTVKF